MNEWCCAYEEAKDKVWRHCTNRSMNRFNGETLYRARTMWVSINDKDVPEIVKLAFTLTQ